MFRGLLVIAELLKDTANTIPCIVMPFISSNAVTVRSESLVIFFISNMFVPLMGEGVCEFRIQLGGTPETAKSLFVITCE
jgi:hypothetical protein